MTSTFGLWLPTSIKRSVTLFALTATWCALWKDLSIANIGAGVILGMAIMSLNVGTSCRGGIRLRPLLQLIWLVLVDLVESTVGVAREILSPTDYTNEAIIAFEIPNEARHHFLLLVIAITLTPGTAVVDADPDTGTLYLHLLHAERRTEVESHVKKIARLACDALPVRPATAPEVLR